MEEANKNIDETWKATVEKEKKQAEKNGCEIPEEPDFTFFITTLGLQASVALGEIPNPANNQKEENLNQAKLIIDTLNLLKEKTKGNLDQQEEKILDNLLYQLRMIYVSKTAK